MASEDTYSSVSSATNIQVQETSKYIKLIVCLREEGGSGEHVHAYPLLENIWPDFDQTFTVQSAVIYQRQQIYKYSMKI
jgi:hypothetical protein